MRITIIEDDCTEIIYPGTLDCEAVLAEAIKGLRMVPGFTSFGDSRLPCKAYSGGDELNLAATAYYAIACDHWTPIFGKLVIVQIGASGHV